MRSRNEIEAIAQKAARGAGFPLGHAEDFARAVGLLAVWRPDQLGCVSVALSARPAPAVCQQQGRVLTVANAGVIMAGPVALDALARECDTVHLLAVDAPDLMEAYAYVAAQEQGLFVQVTRSGDTCEITTCPPFQAAQPAGAVAVPPDIWAAWSALAAQTYVPATAASRLAGAGAGLTDND